MENESPNRLFSINIIFIRQIEFFIGIKQDVK